jgi:hypothetical protein
MSLTASGKVDEYIDALPEEQQRLAHKIRKLLFEAVPQIEERFSFRLPFYHYYGMFCYLHVAKGCVNLCICRGRDLLEVFPQLEQKARASIASVTLYQISDITKLEVPAIIAAAAEWNKEASLRKIPILKKKT